MAIQTYRAVWMNKDATNALAPEDLHRILCAKGVYIQCIMYVLGKEDSPGCSPENVSCYLVLPLTAVDSPEI